MVVEGKTGFCKMNSIQNTHDVKDRGKDMFQQDSDSYHATEYTMAFFLEQDCKLLKPKLRSES